MGVNMDTNGQSNNLDNKDNTELDNSIDKSIESVEVTENHINSPNTFYTHLDGNLNFFPEDTSEISKKQKKTSKSETEHFVIMNNFDTILKKLDQLQKDVNQLMERGKKLNINDRGNEEILKALISNLPNITSIKNNKDKLLKEDTVSTLDPDVFQEFISIYHSSSVKKSLSINKELEDKIKKLIAQHYGITDNDSKIINTALMIALLKMH